MKTLKVRSLVLGFTAGALMLSFAGGALAQSQIMKANIPFDFYVGNKLMPAGEYTVRPNSNGAIYIGNAAVGTFMLTHSVYTSSPRNALVFNRYGQDSFLTTLHWAGSSVGREFPQLRLEKEARERNTPVQLAVTAKSKAK